MIGKDVRTGVHTSLVAPVTVGDDAYTGAGSVMTEDMPAGALGIARARRPTSRATRSAKRPAAEEGKAMSVKDGG